MSNRMIVLVSAMVLAFLSWHPVAAAAEDKPPKLPPMLDEMGPAVEEATRRMMGILELFLRSIPVYETPEILENGDIIIRRKRPSEKPATPAEPDSTKT